MPGHFAGDVGGLVLAVMSEFGAALQAVIRQLVCRSVGNPAGAVGELTKMPLRQIARAAGVRARLPCELPEMLLCQPARLSRAAPQIPRQPLGVAPIDQILPGHVNALLISRSN